MIKLTYRSRDARDYEMNGKTYTCIRRRGIPWTIFGVDDNVLIRNVETKDLEKRLQSLNDVLIKGVHIINALDWFEKYLKEKINNDVNPVDNVKEMMRLKSLRETISSDAIYKVTKS